MINSKYQCLQGGLEKIIIFYINGSTVKRAQSEMPYSLITSPEDEIKQRDETSDGYPQEVQ